MFVRLANNNDKEQIVKLVDTCYKIYGDNVNTNNYDRDLIDIETKYLHKGGVFYVVEKDFRIAGTIAAIPLSAQEIEIKRFYVYPELWGNGYADILFGYVKNYAVNNNYKKISLWTDIRYERAQAFYKNNGFKSGEQKNMDDADNPYTLVKYELPL